VKLVTLNLRHDNPVDRPRDWAGRREAVLRFLRDGDFDVICLQEVLSHQLNDLIGALRDFEAIGSEREPRGEICPILTRLEVRNHGQWWISETPFVFGSKGFDTACPRVITWADLPAVRIYNVHLDHESEWAREMGVRQLLAHVPITPWIAMGDFNAEPDSLPVALMCERATDCSDALPGTFHDFGRLEIRPKIDHIFSSGIGIQTWVESDESLSDHFPVVGIS
jgi:endonuclease/exonuclease/phosphatase family metal-dependent hydrolase